MAGILDLLSKAESLPSAEAREAFRAAVSQKLDSALLQLEDDLDQASTALFNDLGGDPNAARRLAVTQQLEAELGKGNRADRRRQAALQAELAGLVPAETPGNASQTFSFHSTKPRQIGGGE